MVGDTLKGIAILRYYPGIFVEGIKKTTKKTQSRPRFEPGTSRLQCNVRSCPAVSTAKETSKYE
jgi:hypothetical protein